MQFEVIHHRVGSRHEIGLRLGLAGHGLEFSLVGRQQRRPAIFFEVAALRVHQYWYACFTAEWDHPAHFCQCALAVIGEDDGPGAGNGAGERVHEDAVLEFGGILLVQPYQLLSPALHPGLRDRRAVPDPGEVAVDALAGQQRLQGARCCVVADRADEAGLHAQRREVHGDVRRATGPVVRLLHVHDRHGRLRRDAAGRAEQVLVQHDVTSDHHACLGEIRNRYGHSANLPRAVACEHLRGIERG